MGVFSATERRLILTGNVNFVPDLRAAVDISFTMENAWQLNNGVTTILPASTLYFKNYTTQLGANPKVEEEFDGMVSYNNLRFNPGALTLAQADIKITLNITNQSVRSTPMNVLFDVRQGNQVNTTGPIYYNGITVGKVDEVEQGDTSTIVFYLKISSVSAKVDPLNFNFEFSFNFD